MARHDDQERLLQAPRESLQRARRDRSAWEELAFAPALAGQGQAYDLNRAARFGVLWALQYDRRPDDLLLARFLLGQEIIRYEETVPSGLAPDLELAGFLVCEHRQLDDVWLHWRAKNISFDTALGYRTPYLLTAGVEATAEAVRASSHPDRERILHEILDAMRRVRPRRPGPAAGRGRPAGPLPPLRRKAPGHLRGLRAAGTLRYPGRPARLHDLPHLAGARLPVVRPGPARDGVVADGARLRRLLPADPQQSRELPQLRPAPGAPGRRPRRQQG